MTRVELPALSFLAVLSLLFILPLHLKSRNIPFLFVIAWLLVCNIIQGVDAIVWANNALIRAEGWCDLVTPILYALRVALPAVALCVCRQLEIVSSTLDVSYDPRDKYFTSVFHYLMCLVIPVVYAILHFIVQDRRFVLVQEFGCQAAIFPSVPALFLTWLIPLILCIIAVFYTGLSFYNYHRRCSFFSQHLNPRSRMTTLMFFRFIGFCLFVVLLTTLVNILDMASLIGEFGLLDYTSWAAVHQDDSVLVFSKDDRSKSAAVARLRTEVIWWMAPIASFALVAAFASTKECWIAGEHFCIAAKKRVIGLFTPKQKFDLPIQQLDGIAVVPPLTTLPKAVHDPFKSGWDDTLKSVESLKKQTSFKPKVKVFPLRIPSPALRYPSPTNSSSSDEDNDATFAASTQDYLLSPTGKQALGRVGMIILSPKSQSAVDLDVHAESQQLIRKQPVSKVDTAKVDKHLRAPSQPFPTTPENFTSFIPLPNPPREKTLSISAWPRPPTSIPLSPSPSPISRNTLTPSPMFEPSPTSTSKDTNRDSYIDYVRQPSPTFAKATITNRDRAYIFGTPGSVPTFTPPPPPRVSPPMPGQQGTHPVDAVPELKEVQTGRRPVLVQRSGGGSQVSWTPATGVSDDKDVNEVSPSVSSFVGSPSIYSTYSGNQPHPAMVLHTKSAKETV